VPSRAADQLGAAARVDTEVGCGDRALVQVGNELLQRRGSTGESDAATRGGQLLRRQQPLRSVSRGQIDEVAYRLERLPREREM